MPLTREVQRRLDVVSERLQREDDRLLWDVGFRLIAHPDGIDYCDCPNYGKPRQPSEPEPPLRITRAQIARLAAREPRSPFEDLAIHYLRGLQIDD